MRKKSLSRGLLHSKQKGDVAERQVANALETEQSPAFLTVGSRKGDIYTDKFHVESKYNGRKNFIIKNTDWLQEKKRAAMVGKIPLFAGLGWQVEATYARVSETESPPRDDRAWVRSSV